MEGGKPLTAKEKRHEQMKRWENSATDLECATYTNPKIRVKFDDGAVFLAACSAGDLDEVKALLDGGADINFANVDGLTALHQACIDGNLEVVQFLVEQGSNIDQEDNEGWTPLHATASCGFMDIAKYLVEKGAKVGAINSEAELPIDIAEEEDMIDYLQSVIDKQGIDVEEARNIERLIMLEDAKELLEKYQNGEKIDSFSHPKSGATPLHITAAKGYNDVMKILIKVGLDVNAMDNDGWTPLHAASHWSQEESAKILADKNANFKARSKLGQTCFDVADEDMLEYLEELETAQDNDKAIEEPPPEKLPARSPPSATRESLVSEEINDVQNGEKKSLLKDTKVSDPVAPEDEFRLTRRPGSFRSAFTSESKSKETEKSAVENADIDTSDRLQRRNRPASLQISSSNEQTHRPLTSTISEGGSKPVAATQPVQSVTRGIRENGRTSSYTRDKDDPLSSWKTGVRRPTNFDDKPISRSDTEKSSYSSRFSDEAKTARVAPIVDSRRAKESEHDTPSMNDVASGSSRTSSSYSRKKSASDAATNSTVTDLISDPPSSFKRSKLSEAPNEKATENSANDDIESQKLADAEKRRYHLQPVADEEAEARRKIRSRRERQTRRSTQGVTLDVYEEAMRTIGQMKKQTSTDKTDSSSSDTAKSRNDTSSSLTKRDESQSSVNAGAGTPVASLPSGYIPSNQRVKSNESSDGKNANLTVPSISVEATASDDDKGDASTSENNSSTAANRKLTAQQRRRNRSQRRSTGLPDLKPSISATTEPENPEQEEEETTTKDDYLEPSKAERLRQKYDTSSLPGRLDRHRGNVKPSESDIPSRISQPGDDTSSYSPRSRNPDTQNYKKLYEDNVEENERLRTELADAQRKISELQTRLEKAEVNATQKQALENEKRERRVLEQKISEMEKELQKSDGVEELRKTNGHLKAENNALQRIVEKLGGTVPNNVQQILDENKSTVRISSASSIATLGRKFRSESNPDLVKLNSGVSDSLPDQDIASLASPNPLSRSSSSSSLSIEEEKNTDTRRGSLASSDYGSRTARLRDEAGSSSSAGSYSMRKDKSVPSSSYSSSPSLTTRSGSPRRPLASNYGNTYESLRSSNFPRYSGMNKDSTSTYSSTSYNSLPRSSTRRDYSKSSATPSTGSSSTSYLRTGSGYRTTPTPYSTTGSKSSYSANSRSKTGYTSSTSSHSGTSSPSKYSLSKYSTNLSSSRRNAKF